MRYLGIWILVIAVIVAIVRLVAWEKAMQLVEKAARDKGYGEYVSDLRFIGWHNFVAPAAIVSALPDKNAARAVNAPAAVEDELPEI